VSSLLYGGGRLLPGEMGRLHPAARGSPQSGRIITVAAPTPLPSEPDGQPSTRSFFSRIVTSASGYVGKPGRRNPHASSPSTAGLNLTASPAQAWDLAGAIRMRWEAQPAPATRAQRGEEAEDRQADDRQTDRQTETPAEPRRTAFHGLPGPSANPSKQRGSLCGIPHGQWHPTPRLHRAGLHSFRRGEWQGRDGMSYFSPRTPRRKSSA
jgi:hypothetical protein